MSQILIGRATVTLTLLFSFSAVGFQTARGLTLDQIENLLSAGAPAAAIAKEIDSRGLAFEPSSQWKDSLRSRKIPRPVLDAIDHSRPTGNATVVCSPSPCEVLVDGKSGGNSEQDGHFSVNGLSLGSHALIIRKAGFEEREMSFSVSAGRTETLSALLTPLSGRLTVRPNYAHSVIEIDGSGRFPKELADHKLAVGEHKVKVSCSGCIEETKTIEIIANHLSTWEPTLRVDSAALGIEISRLEQAVRNSNCTVALRSSNAIRLLDENNRSAWEAAATCSFRSSAWRDFAVAASKAIRAGGTIQVRLTHHHTVSILHVVVLTISNEGIDFGTPQDLAGPPFVCNSKHHVPTEELRVARLITIDGAPYLEVLSGKPGDKPGRLNKLRFSTSDAIGNNNMAPIQYPATAMASLGAIASVIVDVITQRDK